MFGAAARRGAVRVARGGVELARGRRAVHAGAGRLCGVAVLLAAAALRGLDERPLGRAGWSVVGVGAIATRRRPRRRVGGRLRSRGAGLRRRAPPTPADRERRRPPSTTSAAPALRSSVGVGRRLLRRRRRAAVRVVAGRAGAWSSPVLVPAAVAIALFGADAVARARRAATSPATRRTARCGSRRPSRSRCSPPASRSSGCGCAARARASRGSCSTSAPRPRPASCARASPTRSATPS